jgi:hypothetical protein
MIPTLFQRRKLDGRNVQSAGTAFIFQRLDRFDGILGRRILPLGKEKMWY